MKTPLFTRFLSVLLSTTLLTPAPMVFADDTLPPLDEDDEIVVLSPFQVSASIETGYAAHCTLAGSRLSYGATVGGAKDVRYFRDAVAQGGFPHPNTITPEGLFSEHDLPLRAARGSDLLILTGEAMPARLITEPQVRYLGQIGFSSGLEAGVWHRPPLNLIAVVDKSGSMDGAPLDLVKKALRQIHGQLEEKDQLSIVLYGDRAHVHLEPTRATPENRARIAQAIDAIVSSGSTNMEAGLKVGFDLARRSQTYFHGSTRVMQFTDERPNVGDTSAEGFMGLMEAGSRDGIGQTTIGVGVQFGAELAAKVSSVRGGNLYFFPDAEEMTKTFEEELDTLVTELAYDLEVTIRPAPGLRIAGVYGIPGDLLKWKGDRDVQFTVNTVFLSKRKGAIYVAFSPDSNLPARTYKSGKPLARLTLSYEQAGTQRTTRSHLELPFVAEKNASLGLTRGVALVNEYLGLKTSMTAHLAENNQEKAFSILADLHQVMSRTSDAALRPERELVTTLYRRLSELSGHGEPVASVEPETIDTGHPPCVLDYTEFDFPASDDDSVD